MKTGGSALGARRSGGPSGRFVPWGGPHEAWQFWLSTGRFLLFWVQSPLSVAKRCRKCSCFVPRSRNYAQKGPDNRSPPAAAPKRALDASRSPRWAAREGGAAPSPNRMGQYRLHFDRAATRRREKTQCCLQEASPSRPVARQKGPCSHKDFAWRPSEGCLSWHYDALEALVFHSISDSWARVSTRAWVPF